jgi:Tol biopolymer transport system component
VNRTCAAIPLLVAAFACGPGKSSGTRTQVTTGVNKASDVVLIATERSDRGGRLVGIAIDGSRQTELTELRGKVILDRSPVISRDGRWVFFASNRLRSGVEGTNLWRVPIAGGDPKRLTDGPQVDRDPRFSPDGRWLYFCSNRGGTYDLYRAPLGVDGDVGEVSIVVKSAGQILSPSLSPDGTEVVYMEVDSDGASRLWKSSVTDETRKAALTEGPADMTPAWGPNGEIAFAARVPTRSDADIYVMPEAGGQRAMVLDTTVTDETGPRWSSDGRYLFAIGMYRSANDGKPLLGSVIALDREEQVPVWRALHDPSTVETRLGLGLVPGPIDANVLHQNKPYRDALREVLTQEVLRNESRQSRGAP